VLPHYNLPEENGGMVHMEMISPTGFEEEGRRSGGCSSEDDLGREILADLQVQQYAVGENMGEQLRVTEQ
jgi:hypothetical protein